jgi:O-antigen/teichoic acid export membrane protein
MARILTPNDIGIFSIAASLVGFAHMLRDFGIATYLIQERELTVLRQRSAMGVAIVIAWTIGGLLAAFSGLIGDFYHNPGVRNVALVLSLNFFLIPFSTIVITMLRREMNYRALYRIGLAANLSRAVCVLGMAALGYGFMAMAWSSVVGLLVTVLVAQFEHPSSGRMLPSLKEWRHVISFGTLSTAGQVLAEVSAGAPEALIGRIINPVAVGFYSRANGLLGMFDQSVLAGLAPVALSTIAMRHREGKEIREFLLQSFTHITALGWPFYCFVALMGFPITRILFGDQWDASVPLIRFLCIAAIIRLPTTMNWPVQQGTGSISKYVVVQAITVPAQIALLTIALIISHDLVAIGIATIATAVLQLIVSFAYLKNIAKVSWSDTFHAVAKSCVLTAVSSIGPLIVVLTMPTGPTYLWPPLLLAAAGAAIGFAGAALLLKHPLADEVRNIVKLGWRSVFA